MYLKICLLKDKVIGLVLKKLQKINTKLLQFPLINKLWYTYDGYLFFGVVGFFIYTCLLCFCCLKQHLWLSGISLVYGLCLILSLIEFPYIKKKKKPNIALKKKETFDFSFFHRYAAGYIEVLIFFLCCALFLFIMPSLPLEVLLFWLYAYVINIITIFIIGIQALKKTYQDKENKKEKSGAYTLSFLFRRHLFCTFRYQPTKKKFLCVVLSFVNIVHKKHFFSLLLLSLSLRLDYGHTVSLFFGLSTFIWFLFTLPVPLAYFRRRYGTKALHYLGWNPEEEAGKFVMKNGKVFVTGAAVGVVGLGTLCVASEKYADHVKTEIEVEGVKIANRVNASVDEFRLKEPKATYEGPDVNEDYKYISKEEGMRRARDERVGRCETTIAGRLQLKLESAHVDIGFHTTKAHGAAAVKAFGGPDAGTTKTPNGSRPK